jgi:hypothetical protein
VARRVASSNDIGSAAGSSNSNRSDTGNSAFGERAAHHRSRSPYASRRESNASTLTMSGAHGGRRCEHGAAARDGVADDARGIRRGGWRHCQCRVDRVVRERRIAPGIECRDDQRRIATPEHGDLRVQFADRSC